MFDFEKLDVYQIVKQQNIKVLYLLKELKLDPYIEDQWKRASLSVMLNLAEGTGRMTVADKKHFYTIARSSVFECVALLDLMKGMGTINQKTFDDVYSGYEQISKMLLAMYRSIS
jgi:four helix bundle protein